MFSGKMVDGCFNICKKTQSKIVSKKLPVNLLFITFLTR